MKIDYTQGFETVSRLINMRAKAAYTSASKPAPEATQVADFKAQLGAVREPVKGLNLPPPPALVAPPLAPPPSAALTVKPSTESVKAPTVISVERIEQFQSEPAPITLHATDTSARASLSRTSASLESPRGLARFANLITSAGVETGIDPALGIAVATAESSLDPDAISSDGHASKGLFQLLDRTGVELHAQAGGEPETYNPFEPTQNVQLGMRYLRRLHEYFSAPTEIAGIGTTVPAANSASLEKLAVAAFNAGEGRVTSAQGRAARLGYDPSNYEQVSRFLPDSTQSYVAKVIKLKASTEFGSRTNEEIT